MITGGRDIRCIVIGASTGGPLAIKTILAGLEDIEVPILIVQHISVGALQGLLDWFQEGTKLNISIAIQREELLPGHVYFAPDGYHMEVSDNGLISLTNGEPEYGMKPSVSRLFRSIAKIYGEGAIGILLSGMGKDGAKELKDLKEVGAITIAQDQKSSAVHGMPGEAIKIGAVNYVLSPEMIVLVLNRLINMHKNN